MNLNDGVFIKSVTIDGTLLQKCIDWKRDGNERIPYLLPSAYLRVDLMHHDNQKKINKMVIKYSDDTELVFSSAGARVYDDETYISNP